MQTWTRDDHREFGDGPWACEPDKAVWIDPVTDYDCMINRGPLGALCGYVGVGPEHLLHGVHYSDAYASGDVHDVNLRGHFLGDIRVHGDITYSAECDDKTDICHVTLPGRPDDVWWFGFDCAHCGDVIPYKTAHRESMKEAGIPELAFPNDKYRDFEYVKLEVGSLALQLQEIDRLISDLVN